MGDYDAVLGVEWSHTLGHVTMDFKELYMSLNNEGHGHALKGISLAPRELSTLTVWRSYRRQATPILLPTSMSYELSLAPHKLFPLIHIWS